MSARSENFVPDIGHWSEREVNVGAFKDARLGNRFAELLRFLSDRMGGTIPLACQDWASTKAAYRFFSNPRVEEGDILSGHFDATRTRYLANEGTVLLLQDTTEFTYQRLTRMTWVSPRASIAVATAKGGFAITQCVAY
jgi:hypothetical protein